RPSGRPRYSSGGTWARPTSASTRWTLACRPRGPTSTPSAASRSLSAPSCKPRVSLSRHPGERPRVVGAEGDSRRRHVLLEVRDRQRPRDRHQYGRTVQQPGQRELRRRGRVAPQQRLQLSGVLIHSRPAQRIVGEEGDAFALAVGEYLIVLPLGEAIDVLDGGHLDVLPRLLDLGEAHRRQADVPQLPLLLQLSQGS